MLCWRFGLLAAAAAVMICQPACKKSKPAVAEQNAPLPQQSAPTADATTPAAEPPAEPSVPIAQTAPAPVAPQNTAPLKVNVPATARALPGASEVLAALNRRDYMGAVMGLSAVKARTPMEQRPEYNNLMREVRQAIIENMAKDPSAKRAYDTMRFVEAGR